MLSLHLSKIILPYQLKTQYLQILNVVDTSIKRQISGQSTTVVKGCMYITFDTVDTSFRYWRTLIVCNFFHWGIFQGKRT